MNLAIEIRTIEPDPDSHFRLRPCEKCSGNNARYVQHRYRSYETWRVECPECGHTGERDFSRHGAQVRWNRTMLNARRGCDQTEEIA